MPRAVKWMQAKKNLLKLWRKDMKGANCHLPMPQREKKKRLCDRLPAWENVVAATKCLQENTSNKARSAQT